MKGQARKDFELWYTATDFCSVTQPTLEWFYRLPKVMQWGVKQLWFSTIGIYVYSRPLENGMHEVCVENDYGAHMPEDFFISLEFELAMEIAEREACKIYNRNHKNRDK